MALLLPILLLGFFLRVWGLADHNLWWDEGIGVWLARMPLPEAVRWTAGDVHPPLYYLLLHGWRRIAGEGAFVLRYPSALLSWLTIPVIYRLGRALEGQRRSRVGVLAALFLALSRFAIAWAQEIRMYAPAALLATGALWAAVALWRQEDRRSGALYVATTLGSLYTLYLTATVPVVTNLGFLVAWWRARRPSRMLRTWLAAQVIVVAGFLPWAAYALPQMHSWSSEQAFSPGFFVQLYATMLAVGAPLDLARYVPGVVAVFVVLAAGGIALLWPRAPAQRTPAQRTPAQAGGLATLWLGLALPALVVYVVSLPVLRFYFSRPLVPRYLLPLSACFYTLLAWGIVALRDGGLFQRRATGRFLSAVALAVTVLVAAGGLQGRFPRGARRDAYATIATVLTAHRHPDDAVLLYVDRDWPIFVAHYGGPRRDVPYGAGLDDAAAADLLAPIWAAADGVWLVTTPEALQTDPTEAVPRWLADRARALRTWVTGENALTFYARTPERARRATALAPDFAPPRALVAPLGEAGVLLDATLPQPRYRTGDAVHLSLYWAPPPVGDVRVTLTGPATREVAQGRVPRAEGPTTRQQVDIPLPPDLPGGRYAIWVLVDAAAVKAATFTLVRQAAGGDVTVDEIQHRVDYRLGDAIRLVGYDLPRDEVQPGGQVPLTLYWQATAAVPTRYKVFTHLLGETYNAGNDTFLWGQQDNEPGEGQALTTLWPPGELIVDPYRIPVAPDAPPGTYTLEVGMYGLVEAARLPVTGPDGAPQGDAILLAEIQVVAAP